MTNKTIEFLNKLNKRYDNVKRKLKQAITISLIIGIPVMIFFVLIP